MTLFYDIFTIYEITIGHRNNFTFNVGCSGNLELAIMTCFSISDSIDYNYVNNKLGYKFYEECKNKLGPVLYIPYYIYSKNCQGYVNYIGKNGLKGFTIITDITIQYGIKGIYDYAFANCPNLKIIISK